MFDTRTVTKVRNNVSCLIQCNNLYYFIICEESVFVSWPVLIPRRPDHVQDVEFIILLIIELVAASCNCRNIYPPTETQYHIKDYSFLKLISDYSPDPRFLGVETPFFCFTITFCFTILTAHFPDHLTML